MRKESSLKRKEHRFSVMKNALTNIIRYFTTYKPHDLILDRRELAGSERSENVLAGREPVYFVDCLVSDQIHCKLSRCK